MTIISAIYFVRSVLNSNLQSNQGCSHTIITECKLHNFKSHVKIQIKTVIIRLLRQSLYLTKIGTSRTLSKNFFRDTTTHKSSSVLYTPAHIRIMRLLSVSWLQCIVLTKVLICDHGLPTEFALRCSNLRNAGSDGVTVCRRQSCSKGV